MPGAEPGAFDNLKRVIKGIFKRKKKPIAQNATPSPTPAANQSAKARTSPGGAQPPNTDKPLPPTHPLTTGEHKTPQEAVPSKDAARSGISAADAPNAKEAARDKPEVSPMSATAGTSSGQALPSKEAAAPDAPPNKSSVNAATSPTDSALAPAAKSEDKHSTSTANKLDPAVPAPKSEPSQPNGTADGSTGVADKSLTEKTNESAANKPVTEISDEKIPATEEPPPIKAVKAAPGMSATSGPLEDFPEGGDIDP